MWKFGTLSVSPFDWLEASYFYYRPSDLIWSGTGVKGHYLDKGFNVKFVHRPKKYYFPTLAIGLDDFAGTGLFSKEYIVSTLGFNNTKFSLGLGWGKFTGENSFENPLSRFSKSLKNRPLGSDNYKSGGNLSYDTWFRGDASYFGGIEHSFNKIKGLDFKLEYDPFDYFDLSANNRQDAFDSIRQKDNNINAGFSYSFNKFINIDLSYIKGNTFNFNISFGITFNDDLTKKTEFRPEISKNNNVTKSKNIFYEDLLFNLNRNRLLLQTATLDDGFLDISISTSDHRNAVRSASYAAFIAQKVAELNDYNLKQIEISHINAGLELNNISFIANHLSDKNNIPLEVKIKNTDLKSDNSNGYKKDEFQPIVNFPAIFSSFNPSIVSHIGNPEKFYFGGLNLQNIAEIQFSRNLLFSTEINQPIYSNFEDTISGPGSKMEHVRTDLVQYLKEDDLFITRMQLDYIWSPKKNVYAKLSGGIFESMFAGIGGELLYKPFDRNFLIGLEIFNVKQRTFDQRFDLQDYQTTTGHLNLGYMFPIGIEANLSYGRYLAKDDGYTLDLGRRSKSGFKSGIYFSRTNVSAELFGEGSFDKGFYFQIPLDLFSKQHNGNYSTFKVSPLTRDGGAKLLHDKDLKGLIYNTTIYELNKQWDGYLN